MTTKRVSWVDIAKCICILCVVNCHLESTGILLHSFYSPFFLTLFFFCSGYVYRSGSSFPVFFRKKVFQLLIPWLILSVGNILLSQILTFNKKVPLGDALLWNFLQIRGENDGVWFVSALFMIFLPFFFFIRWYEKKGGKRNTWLLLGISFCLMCLSEIYNYWMDPEIFPWKSTALPWHLEYIFFGMFYMVLGYLFRKHIEPAFDRLNTTEFRWIVWAIYCVWVLSPFFWDVSINNAVISVLLTYIQQCLGIVAVVALCKVLPGNRFVFYIGQNTLLCFALHGKVYSLLQTLCRKLIPDIYGFILDNWLISDIFSVFLTGVVTVILIIPIWMINRWFPIAAGRRK